MMTKKPAKSKKSGKKELERGKSLNEFLETWSDDEEDDFEQDEKMKDNDESSSSDVEEESHAQKKYLDSLQSKDPEFYEFLKENDEELLNFEDSEDDESSDENKPDNKVHRPPPSESLEVASDESDFEDDEEKDIQGPKKSKVRGKKVTKALLDSWISDMEKGQANVEMLSRLTGAFRAALSTVYGGDDDAPTTSYIVEGSAMFNAVIRTCVMKMESVLKAFLKTDKNFKASKRWTKSRKYIKMYTEDLVKLISVITETSVITVLLKHIHVMCPFYILMPKSAKILSRQLIQCWSTSNEEAVRILAFMCILRVTQGSMDDKDGENDLFEPVLKGMYMEYVKNCKFTSPNTRPNIAFMRRSLAEFMNLDHERTYQHAFVYIRQLAIHLRNAITLQKKDSVQSVYNWQFVHSLHLWATLFGSIGDKKDSILEPLIHPLVQVMTGTIKLIYVPKYYPLRFHISKILMNLSKETGKFTPVLPYFTDVLRHYNFNKRTKKLSMKPLDFSCILKCSKSQLLENGFKDSTLDQIYSGLMEALSNSSHKINFPELTTPTIFLIKDFLKRTKVSNYAKKMKQVLDKLTENSRWIESRRKKVSFTGIGKPEEIVLWESKVKADGPPLAKFFANWKQVRDHEKLKNETRSEAEEDLYDYIPSLMSQKKKKQSKIEKEEFKGDILEGDDDDEDDEERFMLKEERGKKRKKEEEEDDDDDDDDDDEENEHESEEEAPKSKKMKLINGKVSSEEESGDDDDEEEEEEDDDKVEDLNLEDFDSDKEENMNDETDDDEDEESDDEDDDDEEEED